MPRIPPDRGKGRVPQDGKDRKRVGARRSAPRALHRREKAGYEMPRPRWRNDSALIRPFSERALEGRLVPMTDMEGSGPDQDSPSPAGKRSNWRFASVVALLGAASLIFWWLAVSAIASWISSLI